MQMMTCCNVDSLQASSILADGGACVTTACAFAASSQCIVLPTMLQHHIPVMLML